MVSRFYGGQEYQQDGGRWTSPHELTAGGYTLERMTVHPQMCVGSIRVRADATVDVRLDLDHDPAGAAPQDVFESFAVEDGEGHEWSPSDVYVTEAQLAGSGRPAQPARAELVFHLPTDIPAPVTLWLGDLDPDRTRPVSLDPPADPAAS